MPATLLNRNVRVRFDNGAYIGIYQRESLDEGLIHDIANISYFWQLYPNFAALLPEDPKGRIIIPGMQVASPAVGLFYQVVGEGFLLRSMKMEQIKPVFFGDTLLYKVSELRLPKVTSKGFKVYECSVRAEKESANLSEEVVGTYEMVAFQHQIFG